VSHVAADEGACSVTDKLCYIYVHYTDQQANPNCCSDSACSKQRVVHPVNCCSEADSAY